MAANLLISGLPAAEQNRLEPFFEKVHLNDGEELVRAGEPIGSIWFIENAVIFTFQPLHNGRHIPAGLAGNDGVAGFELWLGRNLSPLATVAEVGGDALRMNADDLTHEVLGRRSPLNQVLGDYVFNFVTMGAQMAVCPAKPPSGGEALPLAANDPAPRVRTQSLSSLRIACGNPAQHQAEHRAALAANP